jgi:CDP-6-deoxy-D-xylo-4-hexulose-3-dehydrase
MQAAVGLAQLDKLESFISKRRENFEKLNKMFKLYPEFFVLPIQLKESKPAWFGYPITIKKEAPFTRDQFVKFLNDKNIMTRLIFAGNMIKQPAFENVEYRVVGELGNSDVVMNDTLFIGVYPGLNEAMITYVIHEIDNYVKSQKNRLLEQNRIKKS